MKVTLSLFADADISAITDYVELASLPASEKLGQRLYDACYGLSSFPEGFAFAAGIERLGIRRRNVGQYSIFYVVRNKDVLVLRVIHSARDYPKLFAD